MLLAFDLHEYFVDIEFIAVSAMASLQTPGINSAKFDTPKADCFSTDNDASFSEETFDVTVPQIESVVELDGVGDDFGRISVAFVGVHPSILAQISGLTWQYPTWRAGTDKSLPSS